MTECIDCGANLTLHNPMVGEIIECGDCGLELEIRGTNPIEIQPAPEVAEDWGE